MKEKKKTIGIAKRLFSVVLALMMVLPLSSINTVWVYAESNTDTFDEFGSSKTYTGAIFKINTGSCDKDGPMLKNVIGTESSITISSIDGDIKIDSVGLTVSYCGTGWSDKCYGDIVLTNGTISNPDKNIAKNDKVTISNVNATSLTISAPSGMSVLQFNPVTVTKSTHIHDWGYSLVGTNTIKAHCKNAGHTGDDVSLTITASSANYSGNAATINVGTDKEKADWKAAFDEASIPEVHYVGRDGTKLDDTKTAPTTVGKYTAKISAGEPAVTASVDFEIYKPLQELKEDANNAINKEVGTDTSDTVKKAADDAKAAIEAATTPAEVEKAKTDGIAAIQAAKKANADAKALADAKTTAKVAIDTEVGTDTTANVKKAADDAKAAIDAATTPAEVEKAKADGIAAIQAAKKANADAQADAADKKDDKKETSYKTSSKKSTVTVPKTQEKNGVKYTVTSIKKDAFNGKYVKTVKLPSTIKKINSKAFYGDNKLRSLKITSKKISVSKTAFKGIKKANLKKIKVTVSKKMSKKNFNSLKKNLVKQGLKSKNIVRK